MIAFDADVLIYAAIPQHPLGAKVLSLFPADEVRDQQAGVGSTLLVPELMIKPIREDRLAELNQLAWLLSRIELLDVDRDIADLAVAVGAKLTLKAPDALHLATAMYAGADHFLTNNSRDFDAAFDGIEIIFPTDLPDSERLGD